MPNPIMWSLLNDFHYLFILLHFCQHFFIWNSVHPTSSFIIHHIHISKASNRQTSAFVSVHVSAAYSATLQIKHLIILIFNSKFILLVNSLFLSIKAFLQSHPWFNCPSYSIHLPVSNCPDTWTVPLVPAFVHLYNFHFCLSVSAYAHHFCLFHIDLHTKFVCELWILFWLLATTALSSAYLMVLTNPVEFCLKTHNCSVFISIKPKYGS